MARCQPCSKLYLAELVPNYWHANQEYPHVSTRRAHHPSFKDLEQAAERGCELCGLVVELFKSVNGRDTDSWDWPKGLLEEQSDDHVSVHRLVKQLPDSIHTRVQIYIGTSHMYDSRTIEGPQKPVLDLLMVHVGPHWKSERKVPTLKMKLRTRHSTENRVVQFYGYHVGSLPVDPYTGSDANLELAREWLSACKQHHGNCWTGDVPRLPTRVIDVGVNSDFRDVQLVVPEKGSKAEYVALSHCWGGEIDLKLNGENLEKYCRTGLPFEDLPANFKDAIKVTRKLGVRYLWIDSLCILQDSTADWERESKTMTTVYSDCTLTVLAMSSEESAHGFLSRETDERRVMHRETVRVNFLRDSGTDVEATIGRFDANQEESLIELERGWNGKGPGALARRGWTLQEYVLSPRLLLYGANLVHWTCPSARRSANGMSGIHSDDKKHLGIPPVLSNGILEEIFWNYYMLVDNYSARQLTKASDKLPAFSGIAQHFQPVLGDYLAGLWRDDIVRGLWWVKHVGGEPVSDYRAPSWSWASVDGPVWYAACPKKRGPLDVQMLDYAIRLTNPKNPFGQVRSASLTLRGWTMRLDRPLKYRENPGDGIDDLFDLTIDEILQGGNCHDDREWSKTRGVFLHGRGSREQGVTIVGEGHTSWIKIGSYFIISGKYVVLLLCAFPRGKGPRRQMNCLILESMHGLRHEVFKRVGTLEGYVSSNALKKWERREVTII